MSKLPTYENIRLLPETRCVLVMEFKCRKCGVITKHYTQFKAKMTPAGETAFLMRHFDEHPILIHSCEGDLQGYTAVADFVGGCYQFAIHVPSGPANPSGGIILPGGRG